MSEHIKEFKIHSSYKGGGIVQSGTDKVRNPCMIEADKPEESSYMNPMEYLLSALTACTQLSLLAAAKTIGMDIAGLSASVEGDIDMKGAVELSDPPPRMRYIHQLITIKTPAPEKLEELIRRFEKSSPMHNLIRDTGIEYTVEFKLMD